MNQIEFHARAYELEIFPKPFPATRAVPEWYKAMPAELGPGQLTLKRCPPFLESMIAGYIIPVPATIQFAAEQGRLRWTCLDKRVKVNEMVQWHEAVQYKGSPFENWAVLKYLNPWIVKTPPGFSTLFVSPLNRYDAPLSFFSGVIQTDTYYQEVHFPFLCTLGPGQSFTLKEGMPLMQVIPFRRDDWESVVLPVDKEMDAAAVAEMKANRHAYKDNHWKRPEYT
jgi:hypothetical protein